MGLIRVILAALVACAHLVDQNEATAWWTQGAAVFAVKAFFIISGFYMSLVLHERYQSAPVHHFYASRLLRLLPIYWCVAILTVLMAMTATQRGDAFYPILDPVPVWRAFVEMNAPTRVVSYVWFTIVTLVGSDTGMWLGFDQASGALRVAPDLGQGVITTVMLNPVPQSWTIGVELLFYFVAPLIVRRRIIVILALCAASVAFRALLGRFGLSGPPWSRSLFPSELIFFLAGVLAHRAMMRVDDSRIPRAIFWLAYAGALVVTLGSSPLYNLIGASPSVAYLSYVALTVALPFVFMLSRKSRIDQRIGDLAYPIYMSHLFVFGLIANAFGPALRVAVGSGIAWVAANLAAVVLFSFLLDWMIARPLDRLRVRFGARRRETDDSRSLPKPAPRVAGGLPRQP